MDLQRRATVGHKKFKPKELANLSMIQIITLHTISQHSQPMIRHSLLSEINEMFKTEERKKLSPEEAFSESLQKIPKRLISPSSFYTSLEALEKKGLVSFIRNKKGKVETVEKNQLTDDFISYIHQYFAVNMINEHEIKAVLFNKLIQVLRSLKIDSTNFFSIFPFEPPELNFINYLVQNYPNVYMLDTEKVKETLKLDKEIINYSKIKNDQIREPDNDFDISLLEGFNQNYKFFDLNFDEVLRELRRITKPKGIICVFARKELIPPDSSFGLDKIFKNFFFLYNNFIEEEGKNLSKIQLETTFSRVGLKNIEIIEDEGIIFGFGTNF